MNQKEQTATVGINQTHSGTEEDKVELKVASTIFKVASGKVVINVVEIATRKDSKTDFTHLTIKDLKEGFVTIKDAPKALNMKNPDYVRRLLTQGDLEGIKIEWKGRFKWLISKTSIALYVQEHSRKREDRRYTLRINIDQKGTVRKLLDEAGIKYELTKAYVTRVNENDDDWTLLSD